MEPTRTVTIGSLSIGGASPTAYIAGPCVIESGEHALAMARRLREIAERAGVALIFKASYDKANRSSHESYRGPGLREGLNVLAEVKRQTALPVLTDVHRFEEIGPAAEVADVLQIPAFLCRQTDFVCEVARSGRVVNVKKGQFLAPWDMENVVAKIRSVGCESIILTERGVSFGYSNLVSDMRSLVILRRLGWPVVFDATHSVQLPGGQGKSSGGQREYVLPLARAAAAVGIDGVFTEVHDDPDRALCDGPNSLTPDEFEVLVNQTRRIAAAF